MDSSPYRPSVGFVLGLIGGIFIMLGSLVLLFLSFIAILALLALIFGTLVVVFAILLYNRPAEHVTWGVLILVFSCASIVGFGGFIIGLVLGVVGGALGIAFRSEGGLSMGGGFPVAGAYAGPYGVPVTPWRMCMGCGRWISWAWNVCPMCGTQAPIAPWVPKAADVAVPPFTPQAPAPAAPAPASDPVRAPCPTCSGQADWLPAQRRWYCPTESRYF